MRLGIFACDDEGGLGGDDGCHKSDRSLTRPHAAPPENLLIRGRTAAKQQPAQTNTSERL